MPTSETFTTIVIFGASGDLAKKKTYPALFSLFKNNFLPPSTCIIGYARTAMTKNEFNSKIESSLKVGSGDAPGVKNTFLNLCDYVTGQYDQDASFIVLAEAIKHKELEAKAKDPSLKYFSRIFYFALPPSVFIQVAQGVKKNVYSPSGLNRLIIEKPFGRDLKSAKELLSSLASLFKEDEMYRIDHYLGKEMVKNLMTLRFANVVFDASWNRHYIDNIQITFKETIGTDGRGGYFDEFGIIRDVMQNHLLQILAIVAMEKPVSLDSEEVKVLKCIPPIDFANVMLGQYVSNGTFPGYLEDKTVPKGSLCPTYAASVLYINNERWKGVPFILKCGKALSEQKAEIRIQFRNVAGLIFNEAARNELVIRVQPNEAMYMKMMVKKPGLGNEIVASELDLSYSTRYKDVRIPDAYESLILDALRGDHSNFVRDDELIEAWKIFTPLLNHIETNKIAPLPYKYGARGPEGIEQFISRYGYHRDPNYQWKL